MVDRVRKPLGQILVEQGLLSPEDLRRALEEQSRSSVSLREVLLQQNLVSEHALVDYYERLGITHVDLSTYRIEPDVVRLVPGTLCRSRKVIPLFKIMETLTVAMADPLDIVAIDEVQKASGLQVDVVASSQAQILEAVQRHCALGGNYDEHAASRASGGSDADGPLARSIEDGSVVRLVDVLLQHAIREGASDIHIEPDELHLRVRFRVDGVLREASVQPKSLHAPAVSRVKVMAQMDIAERRLPQDGRAQMEVLGKPYDLRVSTFPTIHGENVVLRILDKSSAQLGMEELGLGPGPHELLERMIERPNGVVLVTGPTGSGKTTTLYACIHQINTHERNIMTLEDPVEYHLPLIRQTQVDPDIGLTFARGLRAILRQDPDVIMVGEIRDPESAEIAVRAALTGHLVLSTLHTNDAAGALPRLLDMEIEPFLLSPAMIGVVAQRLLRRVCAKCSAPAEPPARLAAELGLEPGNGPFVCGAGCVACRHSGYRGRAGIFELLPVSDAIRDLISSRAPAEEIARRARRDGMQTLREDALRKAAEGITTLEEVMRVTQPDLELADHPAAMFRAE